MISEDVKLAEGVVIHHPDLVNLYGCEIGAESRIGTFVEIQKGVLIGATCKVSSHSFICEGVTIEDGVFVGHGVMFINDILDESVNDQNNRPHNTHSICVIFIVFTNKKSHNFFQDIWLK